CQASAEHFQQCAESPLLRNRGLGVLAVAVLAIPLTRSAAATVCAAVQSMFNPTNRKSKRYNVHYTPTFPGTNPWPYAICSNLPLQQPRSSSSVPRRLAHSPISTEVKSTVALPGGRALTAPRTGRWLRQALRCLRLSAVRKHRPYRWSSLV